MSDFSGFIETEEEDNSEFISDNNLNISMNVK